LWRLSPVGRPNGAVGGIVPEPLICTPYKAPNGQMTWFVGPPLEAGPLPAVFYFSLSGEESLCMAPVNTPVRHLANHRLRVFSLTLPGHGPGFDRYRALRYWAEELAVGRDLLGDFFPKVLQVMDSFINQGIIDVEALAVAGLSRGAFVATHLAALDPRIKTLCGFAPWIEPAASEDWEIAADHPRAHALSLFNLIDRLTHTAIRFYVGNRDLAVGTERVFAFIHQLANRAHEMRVRSPHATLFILPSIGHRGHGTSEFSFLSGAKWLEERLSV
jgi:pimeloyl-ACP methyl ester carboxylesterase